MTCPDPKVFAGPILVARTLVEEHFLMEPQELTPPWQPGQAYDPYGEPVWRRLAGSSLTSD